MAETLYLMQQEAIKPRLSDAEINRRIKVKKGTVQDCSLSALVYSNCLAR